MRFEQFAAAHGLILQSAEVGRWVRVPTADHPRRKNGSYKFLGDVGWCQNFATMTDAATWFPEKGEINSLLDLKSMELRARKAAEALRQGRAKASRRAAWVLSQTTVDTHPYLARKGFPDARGLIHDGLLVIPMRVNRDVVGIQTIAESGEKRFLSGQRCAGAEFVIDAKGPDYWCEGYATGLSLHAVLGALKLPHRIHVCFSAGNLQKMARSGIVVADNDASGTGAKAAAATGLLYWMPPEVGDMNDLHAVAGLFRLSQEFRKWLK